tara:strand:- start:4609 stop:5517 length:909 start_codon:yes stop_codon:yes gene_type:complete
MEPSEAEALDLLKSLRTPDLQETTDNQEDNAEPEEVDVQEVETSEVDNSELDVEEEALEDDSGPYVYQIGGDEITEDQILEWKQGSLRQSDYSKKTLELSDQRKDLDAKKLSLADKEKRLDDLIETLEGQTDPGINWDELMEDDPSEYLKQKALQEKRADAIKKAKGVKQAESNQRQQEFVQSQQRRITELMPDWIDQSKQKADLELINGYIAKVGISVEEANQITDARMWLMLRDAAKHDAKQGKKTLVEKKVKNAPKVMKPTKQRARPKDTSLTDEAAKKFKHSGSEKDALKYLKAKRSG